MSEEVLQRIADAGQLVQALPRLHGPVYVVRLSVYVQRIESALFLRVNEAQSSSPSRVWII